MAAQRDGVAMKRRGILAAAGAVVAGLVATKTSQSVGAAHQPEDLGLGNGFDNNTTTATTISYFGSVPPNAAILTVTDGGARPTGPTVAALAGFALENGDSAAVNVGVYGASLWSNTDAAGVRGEHFANGTGVIGTSASGRGVYGVSGGDNGVYGNTNAPANSGKAGVGGIGNGAGTYGVIGFGAGGIGVRGEVSTSAANTIAVQGLNKSTGSGGTGVYGSTTNGSGVAGYHTATSGAGQGVYAQTSSPSGFGIVGQNTAPGGTGLLGYCAVAASGAIAFEGSAAAGNYAAVFNGTVYVNGQLVVTNPSYKSGVLRHGGDGTDRLVYCMESPESWIEDFGKAQLVNGKAEVKLDPDFAAVVQTDDYAVFLTPEGDSKGLFVTNKNTKGFVAQEQQGGTSRLAFRYRVVAKPAVEGGVTLKRLEKFTVPKAREIDPSTFPKAASVDVTVPPAPPQPPSPAPAPRPAATSVAPAAAPAAASPSAPVIAPPAKVDVPAPAPPSR